MSVTNEDILLALRDVAASLTGKIDAVAAVQVEHGKHIAQLQSDMTEVKADLSSVKADLSSVKVELSSVKVELSSVKVELSSVKVELSSVKTSLSSVQADVKTLQSDMTEVKHIVGVNHLKLSGKIEMVASMLADHMVDHHEPAGRRRA